MKLTIQYFEGCPHWKLAEERVQTVLRGPGRNDTQLEHELIDSLELAARLGFHGSPTILVDGRDPFATGAEPVGMSCRTYQTDEGFQGAPSPDQVQRLLA